MREKITARLIDSLSSRSTPYEVCDTQLPGFRVRVQPSGVIVFLCAYRNREGARHRVILGRASALSAAQARDEAIKVLAEVAQGADPALDRKARRAKERAEKDKLTLEVFLTKEYLPSVQGHLRSAGDDAERLKRCFPGLLTKKLEQITSWDIEKWRIQRLKKDVSAATINRGVAVLSAVLSKAVQAGALAETPLRSLKPMKVDSDPIVRFLEPKEESSLRAALDSREQEMKLARERGNKWRTGRGQPPLPALHLVPFVDHLKPMVLISMNTGLRQGELFKLEWRDIDLIRAVLTVRAGAAKGRKARHIPLNTEAADVLRRWKMQTHGVGLVFPSNSGGSFNNVKKAWARVLHQANISEFRWHDLRHHFASRLVTAGVDLNTVRELLGHADLKMTLRYAHLAAEHKAAAVAKLARA